MTFLIYDGSFEGLLTAIYEVYALKLVDVRIITEKEESSQLFSTEMMITTNDDKANKVAKKITNILGSTGFRSLWKAMLSELPGTADIILSVVKYAISTGKNVIKDYGHPAVLALQETLKKLGREQHRMTAFVRFELAQDGVFYATIEPDFDVLPLISNHFRKRYADQKWLIFDLKRNYGIFYDLQRVITVEVHQTLPDNSPSLMRLDWDETEKEFQNLWKNYFKATNIVSRKNTKLHLQHVPRRYWKYLIEKQ
ncbi:TIGR03915 family putative DNA repair protein [Anditalea andensis]|nr:TIGR03915 family putative DNA repair protein [Anditalea andensis]